jgi:hypothetical protein
MKTNEISMLELTQIRVRFSDTLRVEAATG